jgi:hypothetical protein
MGWLGDAWDWVVDTASNAGEWVVDEIKETAGFHRDQLAKAGEAIKGAYEDITGQTAAQIASDAALEASGIEAAAADAGIAETRRQFDAMQELLKPYVAAGTQSLAQQQALAGLAGPEAQAAAIAQISGGEEFKSMYEQGENAMLQNASATGGIRGGNTQGALAQFRPQVLSSLINQQYGRLGGLTQMGQSSAAGVGAAGMQTGAQIAGLLGQQGAALAGGTMAAGQAEAQGNYNAWAPVRQGAQLASMYYLGAF